MKALEGKSSELHWRDPVALSVGQPGAPVSSKDCAHGSSGIQVAHSGGEWKLVLDFLLNPGCDDAMHCRYGTETKKKAREAPEQFCRIFSNRAPCNYARSKFCYLNVVGHNSFSHVFENDAVVKPLCPLANLFGGCFCLGSGPFRLSGLLFLLTKRKSGWGFAGRLAGLCVVVVVVICLHFQTVLVLVQSDVLPLMLM